MELNREEIIKTLECLHQRILSTRLAEKITEAEMMAIIDALAIIKELTEENERLHASYTELTQCCTKLETLYKIECKRVDTVKADTVQQIQLKMAMRYGTYTDKDMTPITEVFSLLDQIAKEMLEGQSNGIY